MTKILRDVSIQTFPSAWNSHPPMQTFLYLSRAKSISTKLISHRPQCIFKFILGRSVTAGLRINLVNKYKQDNLPFTNTYLILHHHFPQFSKNNFTFSSPCSLSTCDICRHAAQGRSNCTTLYVDQLANLYSVIRR